jgi:hypothetical protein
MAFRLAHLMTIGIIMATSGVSFTTADKRVTGTLFVCVRARACVRACVSFTTADASVTGTLEHVYTSTHT